MSFLCLATPTALVFLGSGFGINPKGKFVKFVFDMSTIGVGLYIGLPVSVAIFPPVSEMKGKDLEKQFHVHENIYFNKGL